MADDKAPVPYQVGAQVRQAQAELENARAYGQESRVASARKLLDGFGAPESAESGSADKRAADKRAAADDGGDKARSAAPAERATRQEKQGTATGGSQTSKT
jgi:hypothetical protein